MDSATTAPQVICGPMVRRVDPGSVTVFVAVRAAGTVTLTVFEVGAAPAYGQGTPVATGSRATVALGRNLHVVAVTATGEGLLPGRLYGYDLAFDGVAGGWPSLFVDGVVAVAGADARRLLSYAGDPRVTGGAPAYPTFATPPADPGRLRIFHGSCRRPHGLGRDALVTLDPIIAAAPLDPDRRPHQLVLTGDQIYADNVADPLLSMVLGHDRVPARDDEPEIPARTGIADDLGMAPEPLPDGSTTTPPLDRQFRPGTRAVTLSRDAKFTSGEADSHLMSLREWVCMYLLTWSDQLWPAVLPRFEEVFPAETRILKEDRGPDGSVYDRMRAGRHYVPTAQQEPVVQRYLRWQAQALQLTAFQVGLVAVRRALANVPSYLVADDHEVTDDWNMTREFVTGAVIGSPLGRRIVRNGMAAYAIFQVWGNDPQRFAAQGATGEPGRELLAATAGWLAAPSAADDERIRTRLGLPTAIDPQGRPVRPAGALTYHFSVTWPRYQLLALDTRTWREYPAGDGHPGGLLLADAPLDEMVRGAGVLGDDAVTVVAQPVALFGMPALEQLVQPVLAAFARYDADYQDTWALSDAATHKLLGRLFSAAPAGPDGVRRRRIVMLGGDIHFGFAERIRYSATLPYTCGPDPAHPFQGVNRTEGVIAGFVSSALRNESDEAHWLHDYGYLPLLDVLPGLDLVGWANEAVSPAGQRFQAGTQVTVAADAVCGWWVSGRPAVSDYDGLKLLSRPPEWQVQVRYVHHDEADPQVDRGGTPQPVLEPTGLPREQALAQYLAAARNLDGYLGRWGNGKEIVGYNNLGEITFDWPAGERKSATQRLWWQLPGETGAAPLTAYQVDLSFGCSLSVTPPYGGYLLRYDDRDAVAGGKARYDGAERPAAVVTDTWVARLQADLATLGFGAAKEPGRYDAATWWAVREFQTYARRDRVAHEPADATATRYSDRLVPVDVPEAERYLGPVSGTADLATQVAIRHWLERRWRCPVVVEAWQVAGSAPHRLVTPNVWRTDQEVAADQRLYSRVVTGRPAGAGPAPAGHPELIPLGGWSVLPDRPQWAGPLADPTAELLPEALLPPVAGQSTGPSLAGLVTATGSADSAVAERARQQLSTFKVLRAVAESSRPGSTGAWFDVLVGADEAVLRLGPFGWPAHGPLTAAVTLPLPVDMRAEPGQLWAWLAALRATDRDAYEALGGAAGLTAVPGFGRDGAGLVFPELRLSRARAAMSDVTGGAGEPVGNLLELRDLRGWHWVHRFLLALRGHQGVRRSIWRFARQGLHDLLATPWDPPAGTPSVPDVPGADGNPRRVRVGDLFTSERAVALLTCWHAYRAHQVVGLGVPNLGEPDAERTQPRAAAELRDVLTRARAAGADVTGPPTGWTDAHEAALITAIGQVTATDPGLAAALAAVAAWPTWPGGVAYQLPVAALPATERTLSAARGSLRLDLSDLPRVTP